MQHGGVAIDNALQVILGQAFAAPVGPWLHLSVQASQFACAALIFGVLERFAEDLPVNYGDVDFCLECGSRLSVILDPSSRWTHFESASRTLAKKSSSLSSSGPKSWCRHRIDPVKSMVN